MADTAFTPEWQEQNVDIAKQRIETRIAKQTEFMDEPGAKAGLIAQLNARENHNIFDRLHHISVPTTVLAGYRDGQAPVAIQKIWQTILKRRL